MLTVCIFINGSPIYTRTAVRVEDNIEPNQPCTYELDTGQKIKHLYEDGAVVLAKKMLDTVKEVK